MMKSGFSALLLSALVAVPTFASQLSPLPEAGLWRSENRVIIDDTSPPQVLDEATPGLSFTTPVERRALQARSIKDANPVVNMECLTPQQAAELFQIGNLQQEMQRKVPECDLTVHPVDRSTLKLQGQCHGAQGFHGEMRGQMEVISSHEFQTTFLGEGRMPADPHDSNSRLQDVSIQRNEVFRWSAADCGTVLPRERLSF